MHLKTFTNHSKNSLKTFSVYQIIKQNNVLTLGTHTNILTRCWNFKQETHLIISLQSFNSQMQFTSLSFKERFVSNLCDKFVVSAGVHLKKNCYVIKLLVNKNVLNKIFF